MKRINKIVQHLILVIIFGSVVFLNALDNRSVLSEDLKRVTAERMLSNVNLNGKITRQTAMDRTIQVINQICSVNEVKMSGVRTMTSLLDSCIVKKDTLGILQNFEKQLYFYNGHTQVDSIGYLSYVTDISNWWPTSMYVFTYDANHEYLLHCDAYMVFPSESGAIKFKLIAIDYEIYDGFLYGITLKFGNDEDGYIDLKRYYFYYSDNLLTDLFIWDGTTTDSNKLYLRNTFMQDETGRIVTQIIETSPDSISWVYDRKTDFTYHSQDTSTGESQSLSIAKDYPFDGIMNRPMALGLINSETTKRQENYQWVNFTRSLYSYCEQCKINDINSEQWMNNQQWLSVSQTQYTYVDGILQNQLLKILNYNTMQMEDSLSIDYFHSFYEVNNQDITAFNSNLNLMTYPSPFSEALVIKADSKQDNRLSLDVYNIKGQKVYSKEYSGDQKVIWNGKNDQNENLTSGVYFVRVNDGKNAAIKKVLKVK